MVSVSVRRASKVFIVGLMLFLSFFTGSIIGHASQSCTNSVSVRCVFDGYTWIGKWSKKNDIQFVNLVSSSYQTMKALVNNAALDSWNNNQSVIKFTVSPDNSTGGKIKIRDINQASLEWTGKAEGASYNWDSSGNYVGVEVMLNVGKGITDYSNTKLTGLIAHEFGHALGLKHRNHSTYLMYCYDSRLTKIPNSDEVSVLQSHYNN